MKLFINSDKNNMQPLEEVLKGMEKSKKKVMFSPETKEQDFTPYKKTKSHPNYSIMKKTVLDLLSKEEYEQLTLYLKQYMPQELKDFFIKEGKTLFNWALVFSSNPKALSFLVQIIPEIIVIQILTDKDFVILNTFLGGQKSMESDRRYSQKEKELTAEKIKIIFKLDDISIIEFVKRNTPDSLKFIVSEQKTASFL